MKRWPLLVLLASLTGCVSEPGPDVVVYDGGGYYEDPREFQADYDRRYLYGRQYYYPSPYYYGGGYSRWRGSGPDRDDRDDRNAGRGRERERGDRPAVPTPPRAADRSSSGRDSKSADSGSRVRERAPSAEPSRAPSGSNNRVGRQNGGGGRGVGRTR